MPTQMPWFTRGTTPSEPGVVFTLMRATPEHPAGHLVHHEGDIREVIELPDVQGYAKAVSVSGHVRVRELHVAPQVRGESPVTWFLAVSEPGEVPAMTLLAFADERFSPGALVAPQEALASGVKSSEQIAAVRWLPGSGVVHQVYVQPEYRRQRVGSTLLTATSLMRSAHDWPALHGGAERTELGDLLLRGAPEYWQARIDPLERIVPSMNQDS